MSSQNRKTFTSAEVARILADESDIDNDVQEDSEDSSSDESEEDAVISGGEGESSENSDDQSGEENEEDEIEGGEATHGGMMSKDGQERWSRNPIHGGGGRQPARNIMRVPPGPTANALRNTTSIASSFELFVTRPIQQLILKWTNKEGLAVYGEERWVDVGEVELKCFIGLLILVGLYKGQDEPISNLWSIEHGRDIFRKSMARDRFTTLTRCIRFDDAASRRQRRNTDKLSPIRELMEMRVESLQSCYTPYENVTVDEQLVTFRGRCPFKQYIPSKPGKYGINIWVMCDSTTHYVCNLQVYTGRAPDQPRDVNQGQRVVLDLVQSIARSGRNVTCDNFFTSLSLARRLESMQLTLLGTIRSHRRELPLELSKATGRVQHSSLFGFQKTATLVSYCPTKGRVVVLLSSMHDKNEIQADNKKKPLMIVDYNKTKAGVDTLDQMVRTYTTKRKTRRWPLVLFYNLLDISAVNGYVMWLHANPEWKKRNPHKRRLYLEALGKELLQEYQEKRSQQARGQQPQGDLVPVQPVLGQRGRCAMCPRSADVKHRTRCSQCQNFICKEHIICSRCGSQD